MQTVLTGRGAGGPAKSPKGGWAGEPVNSPHRKGGGPCKQSPWEGWDPAYNSHWRGAGGPANSSYGGWGGPVNSPHGRVEGPAHGLHGKGGILQTVPTGGGNLQTVPTERGLGNREVGPHGDDDPITVPIKPDSPAQGVGHPRWIQRGGHTCGPRSPEAPCPPLVCILLHPTSRAQDFRAP